MVFDCNLDNEILEGVNHRIKISISFVLRFVEATNYDNELY